MKKKHMLALAAALGGASVLSTSVAVADQATPAIKGNSHFAVSNCGCHPCGCHPCGCHPCGCHPCGDHCHPCGDHGDH